MLNEDLLREIDERKRSEQRLQESEENFRTFFEAVDDMVIVGSADGRIMYTNPPCLGNWATVRMNSKRCTSSTYIQRTERRGGEHFWGHV